MAARISGPASPSPVAQLPAVQDRAAAPLAPATFIADPYRLALGPRHLPLRRHRIESITYRQFHHGRRHSFLCRGDAAAARSLEL